MFHAGRWAGAFLAVSGKDADEAFLCLKALAAQVKTVQGLLSGRGAALKLEKLLRESASSSAEETPAVEYAVRFLCLLVEKNCFRYTGLLLQRIEQELDGQNGILSAVAEAAAPVDGGFERELERAIKEKTGAAGVKLKTTVRPELLGGYILRIGSFYIDASLKGQLESMAAHLSGNTGGRDG
ncbi:MAG: F0F1 ATP synthase subunit delta [Treponema sp.]|jgi:F0F1-type ATP synthase delta subunit|nr:F0F1 ATP synthase subunit delta [Treponema sp.]